MRKEKLLLLALMSAIVFTGCKKKEPVDLSSLHTTAAVEKETMPSTTEAPTVEATAPEDKKQEEQFTVKAETKSYTDKNASVEYPVFSNIKDSEKQKQVNELLLHNAKAAAAIFGADGAQVSLKATVEASNLRRITVTYKGTSKSAGKTNNIFFTNVIDLETAENLQLSDYTDPYTAAGYIASGDYKFEPAMANEQAVRAYINAAERNTDYYYKLLKAADFPGGYATMATALTADSWPSCFSYEKQGVIYISLPLSEELGSYAVIKYSPDNK